MHRCLQLACTLQAPARLDCLGACGVVACSCIDPGLPHDKCACRAPEQVDAEFGHLGTHTDVWGFATCFLHLATGQLPYQDLSQLQMVSAMLEGRAPGVSTDLPDWLQHILRQALTFDPAARPSVAMLHKVHTPRTLQLPDWGWFSWGSVCCKDCKS